MGDRIDNNNSRELKAIAKGGMVVTLGRFSGRLLRFLLVIMVVRLITKADFGVISLAYIVLGIGATIALLGMGTGLPRFIARTRGKYGDDSEQTGKIIGTGVVFVMLMTVLSSLIIFMAADQLSELFNNARLVDVFQVFSFLLLPMVGVQFISSIFQGLERSLPRFVFQDVLMHVTRIAMVVPLFLLEERFMPVVLAYVVSAWLTFIIASGYTMHTLKGRIPLRVDARVLKELIQFSFPLFGIALIINSSSWIGTLFLGLWATPTEIASYTVAFRIAEVLTLGIVALGFIFMPMATRAVAEGENEKLKHLYASTTKWASVFSLPLLFFLLFDTEYLIALLFSKAYLDAVPVVRILVTGYFVHIVLGLNGSTLLAFGDSGKVFVGSLLYGTVTAILAVILTEPFAGVGVAVAVSAGLITCNIYLSYNLYKCYNVPPFDSSNLKPLLLVVVSGIITAYVCTSIPINILLFHIGIIFVLYMAAFVAMWVSKGVDRTDIEILSAVERKFIGSDKFTMRLTKSA